MHTYFRYASDSLKQNWNNSFYYFQYTYQKMQKNKHIAPDNKTPTKITKFLCVIRSKHTSCSRRHPKAPHVGKYAVQSTSSGLESNQGSATIEAVCIMPILLFAFWAFYSMGQIYILENQIYQATMNTADYLAEYAYLAEDTGMELLGTGAAYVVMQEYLPKDRRIENYVTGGPKGLVITSPVILDEEGFFCLQVRYRARIPVPLLQDLSFPVEVQVRQKAYTGYQEKGKADADQRYVYLTEYSSVYHNSRSCSHLNLTVFPVSAVALQSVYGNLKPCDFCGNKTADTYYVTATGDCYHTSMECSGLKRTVRRVPFSQVSGYLPCSRCGE